MSQGDLRCSCWKLTRISPVKTCKDDFGIVSGSICFYQVEFCQHVFNICTGTYVTIVISIPVLMIILHIIICMFFLFFLSSFITIIITSLHHHHHHHHPKQALYSILKFLVILVDHHTSFPAFVQLTGDQLIAMDSCVLRLAAGRVLLPPMAVHYPLVNEHSNKTISIFNRKIRLQMVIFFHCHVSLQEGM